uniref:Uncharacterized protein n=1 Tax=Rhizophora mucronata TaxID=61149 RepID=A0A2P2PTR1_RHIMU
MNKWTPQSIAPFAWRISYILKEQRAMDQLINIVHVAQILT